MGKIELPSYAKINLTLAVSALRSDGYHDIDSVVQVIDLCDNILIAEARPGVIEVTADAAGVPSGSDNLVYLACKAFFEETGVKGGARCFINKVIPSKAGLGGGSGNAATAIIGLDRLYETGLDHARLVKIAGRVGSDVPLYICSGTVRIQGRGENVHCLPDAPKLDLVIIKPSRGVSTAWAYAELDKRTSIPRNATSDTAERAIIKSDKEALLKAMSNEFEPVVAKVTRGVAEAKQLLVSLGARKAMLCGSGSAVFGVFDSRAEAQDIASRASAAAENLGSPFAMFVASSLPRPT